MKKNIGIAITALMLSAIFVAGNAQAARTPGWTYNEEGNPLYYYPNGVYYDPSTQSYGGSVEDPEAEGPQSLSAATFTPGAPDTGLGGRALYFWGTLILSGVGAVFGTRYLLRNG